MRVVLWVVTVLRVALLPVFLVVAGRAQAAPPSTGGDPTARWVAIALLLMIGLSDVVDGWIARRFDLATQFGAFADAAADKLVQVTLVTFFTLVDGPTFGSLPLWFLVLLIARDVILGIGWAAIRARTDIVVVHRPHGRVSSVLVFLIAVWLTLGLAQVVVTPLLLLATALIVVSTFHYSRDGLRQLPSWGGASS